MRLVMAYGVWKSCERSVIPSARLSVTFASALNGRLRMDLIVWRHAEAEDGSPDHERKLTANGMRQAHATAAWLRQRLPADCRILVSPAVRTQQTVRALTDTFETSPEVGVGVSPKSVLQAAGWPSAAGACLIVGHQPTLGMLISQVLCRVPDGLSVKKSGVWWLAGTSQKTVLRAVINADMLDEKVID